MDFIQRFVNYSSEYESPTSFWRWSAYALIAAILRDSCWYPHGISKTYPNIYVILLAESAEYRKSGPFPLVSTLVNELKNTKMIEGRASVQGIIEELSQDVGAKNGAAPIRGGSCIIIADELAAFFVNDPQLIPLITTMYDFKIKYPYKLRTNSIEVKNLCLTMLAASNSTFLQQVYTVAAKYGGLLGRTLMIKPDETRPPNDLLSVDLSKYDLSELKNQLIEIRNLKGPFTATEEAKYLYRDWYHDLYKSYKKFPDSTGVTQRLHSNALKVAMLISASKCTLTIDLNSMSTAIEQLIALRPNYEMYSMGSGKSDKATIGATVINALWEAKDKTLTRQTIMFRHWNDFTHVELDEIIVSLEQAGMIVTIMSGNEISYKMTPKGLEKFERKI